MRGKTLHHMPIWGAWQDTHSFPTLPIPCSSAFPSYIPLLFLSLSLAIISYSLIPLSLPLLSHYFKDLTQDNKRLEKNHRLLSIFFYFNFSVHFSRPKSFWPTLSLYSSFHFSLKTVKSSVNYLPPPLPPAPGTPPHSIWGAWQD